MGENNDIYDVIIIGGGTTGLFTAFYCGMRNLKTKLIEFKSEFGGKVKQMFPDKLIYDVGGIPPITGDALVEQMKEQATLHHPTIIQNQWIEMIAKTNDGVFTLTSSDGAVHQAKTVILATGNGRFDPIKLNLNHIEAFEAKSIHHTISNPQQFAGKKIMIASSFKTGLEWALALVNIAEKVYLVNRKNTFQKASEDDLQRLEKSSIMVRMDCNLQALRGEDGWLHEVTLESEKGEEQIRVDHLLTFNGLQMVSTPFESWGLDTDGGRVAVNHQMMSNIEGIFAAGDAAAYPGKTMLIASGYAEALSAVNSVAKYLNPKAPAQVYSTIIYRK
ncbi:NAD(P)/FAD-dependent oxidoreductase [Ornithinibacillus xuwenensis]|uniref:Ferredoxin--NADP reductase n=1 Tax=Ornithinibacillus xuwenensis TaxID=3144668 RepID=A0ABU9XIA3_9BACI